VALRIGYRRQLILGVSAAIRLFGGWLGYQYNGAAYRKLISENNLAWPYVKYLAAKKKKESYFSKRRSGVNLGLKRKAAIYGGSASAQWQQYAKSW